MRVDELRLRGMTPDDARRDALRQFGDLEATRQLLPQQDEERENEMQRALLFQDFMQDLRIGVRSLLRAPVLTLTIIVTVGLGLGATAAIFSAVSAALLRPLPYAEPENWFASTPTRRRSSSASRWWTTWRSPSSRRGSSGTRPTPIAR